MHFEAIILLLAIGLMVYFFIKYQREAFLPSILTTLGILGTFIGIFIGLFQFDTSNVVASVPALISGIRIAALCSIAGMGLAIAAKFKYREYLSKLEEYPRATADTLAHLLEKIEMHLDTQSHQTGALINTLTALPSHFKSVTDQMDNQSEKILEVVEFNHKAHMEAFKGFSDKVVDNSTEALVTSLERVVTDFNDKVNAQFGENFNLFNEALDKLLKWQEDYYQDIGEMQQQFDRCLKGIEASESALSNLGNEASSLVEIAQNLSELTAACEENRKFLTDNLDSFRSLASQAKEAFPIIENNLNLLTNDLRIQVNKSISQMVEASEAQQKVFTGISSTFGKLESNIVAHTNTTFNILNTRLSEQNERSIRQLEETVVRTSKRIEEQIDLIDKSLEQELTKSLQSLGTQLAKLSQQFVTDYAPLTDKLRDIVLISQNLPTVSNGAIN